MAIRFTSGQQGDFELYEPGTYDFRVVSATQGTSKNGNPQLTVKCVFVGGKYDGKQFTSWYSLLDNSMWKLAQLVEAAGCAHVVTGTDTKGNPIIEFEEADLVDCIFTGDVTINEYNGKKNNRLDKERPSDLVEQDEPAPEPAPAQAAPAPTPAPAKPVATTQTMARRPRTVAGQGA